MLIIVDIKTLTEKNLKQIVTKIFKTFKLINT